MTYGQELRKLICEGEAVGHKPEIKGATLDDTCFCSCGWKSACYWDGAEYAYADWVKHFKHVQKPQ